MSLRSHFLVYCIEYEKVIVSNTISLAGFIYARHAAVTRLRILPLLSKERQRLFENILRDGCS